MVQSEHGSVHASTSVLIIVLHWCYGQLRFLTESRHGGRKYKKLDNQTLAFYEPALKLWHKQGSFHQEVIIPVQATSPENLFVMETALQKEFKPVYNYSLGSTRC